MFCSALGVRARVMLYVQVELQQGFRATPPDDDDWCTCFRLGSGLECSGDVLGLGKGFVFGVGLGVGAQ